MNSNNQVIRLTSEVVILDQRITPKHVEGHVVAREVKERMRSSNVILHGVQIVYGDLNAQNVVGISGSAGCVTIVGCLRAQTAAFDCDVNAQDYDVTNLSANGVVFATGDSIHDEEGFLVATRPGRIRARRIMCTDLQADSRSNWPAWVKKMDALKVCDQQTLLESHKTMLHILETLEKKQQEKQHAQEKRTKYINALYMRANDERKHWLVRLKAWEVLARFFPARKDVQRQLSSARQRALRAKMVKCDCLEKKVQFAEALVNLAPMNKGYILQLQHLRLELKHTLEVQELRARLAEAMDPYIRVQILRQLASSASFAGQVDYEIQHAHEREELVVSLKQQLASERTFEGKKTILQRLIELDSWMGDVHYEELQSIKVEHEKRCDRQRSKAHECGRGRGGRMHLVGRSRRQS